MNNRPSVADRDELKQSLIALKSYLQQKAQVPSSSMNTPFNNQDRTQVYNQQAQQYPFAQQQQVPSFAQSMGAAGGLAQQNLNLKQRALEAQIASREDKLVESRQRDIDTRYKKQMEDIDKSYTDALEIINLANQAKSLIATGNTRAGLMGNLPTRFTGASNETFELDKIYNQLAAKMAESMKGSAYRAKIMTAKSTKPNLFQPKEAQLYLLNDIINQEGRMLSLNEARNDILEENNGRIPVDFGSRITQKLSAIYNPENAMQQTQQGAMQPQGMPQQENLLGTALRTGAGIGARVAEGAATGLGNLVQAGGNLADYIAQAGGLKTNIGQAIADYSPLPTSESVQKRLSQWTGGFTDPQSDTEKFLYDVASTFGSIFMPGAALPKFVNLLGKVGMTAEKAAKTGKIVLPFAGYVGNWKPILAASAAGEGVDRIAENMGASNPVRTALKAGTMMAIGTAGTRSRLNQEAVSMYENAHNKLSGIKVDTRYTIGKLTALQNKIKRIAAPGWEEEVKRIEDIKQGMISTKNISQKGSPTYKMDAGEIIKQRQGLNQGYEKASKGMKEAINKTKNILDVPLAKAAKSNNLAMEGWQDFMKANDIWASLNAQNNITQWFVKNADFKTLLSPHHGWISSILNGIKTSTAFLGRDIAKVQQLFKTSIGRKAYMDALKAAKNNDMNAFIQHLSRLDKIATQLGI